ncbi:MAG: helix-turn-helix domain-containing protein [Desulfovibrio sp.]|jgi:hypothetical protein|nr:helix-turn-helix domain-containing protein [Desulfovibrio sp.]
MSGGKEYTHKDLSRLLGVSETTVKSYRRKFPGCIPVAGYGKPIRFGEDALRVARRIRDLFEHGLSVAETHARLAGEFDWIAPPQADADEQQPAPAEDETLRPDPNTLLAGLARSMVDIFLGQKEIIKRLEYLAALLQAPPAVPLAPTPFQGTGHNDAAGLAYRQPDKIGGEYGSTDARNASASDTERHTGGNGEYGPPWMDDASVYAPAHASGRHGTDSEEYGFTDARDASGIEPKGRGESRAEHDPEARAEEPAGHVCRIFPLRRQDAPELAASDAVTAPMPERGQVEPPRRFLALPLMAAVGNGGYIGAGGKRRGRFSLNDLKALFVFTFTPPRHFRFLWEEREDAWMLRMEQEHEGRRINILLAERSLREGSAAAVVLRLEENGEDRHPAEICAIIDTVGT